MEQLNDLRLEYKGEDNLVGAFGLLSGTSASAPTVAGALATIAGNLPDDSSIPTQFRKRLGFINPAL